MPKMCRHNGPATIDISTFFRHAQAQCSYGASQCPVAKQNRYHTTTQISARTNYLLTQTVFCWDLKSWRTARISPAIARQKPPSKKPRQLANSMISYLCVT